MARKFKPNTPFDVAMKLLTPTSKMEKGVKSVTYSDPKDSPMIYGSFRTYGGTENFSNDVYTIFDTAVVETWYRPDIKADCKIYVCETEETYRIISPPENIEMRHQFMQFKVERVGGKT